MPPPPPYTATRALDRGFAPARAGVLEIAALLDRLGRAGGDADRDPRLRALLAALPLLTDGSDRRVARILDAWSDPTEAPAERAVPGAATGVYAAR